MSNLLHEVWGDRRSTLKRSVDVFIMHLRKKLEVDPMNPKLMMQDSLAAAEIALRVLSAIRVENHCADAWLG